MLPLHRLYSDIKNLLEQKERIIMAIDGMSAAGKSSFAGDLAKQHKCNLIHMDHFFLRPEQRTSGRLKTPGGNIDIERFLVEVAKPLASGKPFSYRPYDCKTQKLLEPVVVTPEPLIIVEGVYSTSPDICKHIIYDITIFMRVNETKQLERLKERNPGLYSRFVDEWIPMENVYFEAFGIADKCDHILEDTIITEK